MTFSKSLPEIRSIAIHDPGVALTAWEVFEASENRRKVHAIAALRDGSSEAEARANHDFGLWQTHVNEQAIGYRKSIERILQKRGLSLPAELDDLVEIAMQCGAGDRLVCHVAMLKCYMFLALGAVEDFQSKVIMIPDIDVVMKQIGYYEVALYQVERNLAYWAVAPFREKGYDVEDWFLVANPFAADGPQWEINPGGLSISDLLC